MAQLRFDNLGPIHRRSPRCPSPGAADGFERATLNLSTEKDRHGSSGRTMHTPVEMSKAVDWALTEADRGRCVVLDVRLPQP